MIRFFRTLLVLNLICYSMVAQTYELDSYIQQGLHNSPLLKDYQNQLQSGSIDSAILNAERKPQLNGIGQILVAPTYNSWGYDQAVTNTGNYLGVASVNQNILNKKIYAPQYEAIRIERQAIGNTSNISEHNLKKNIIDQYLTAYSSLMQMQLTQTTYKLLKNEELILQKFVQQGIYKQTDYLSFEIALQSQEIQIKQFELQYKIDLRQLNIICGINDTAYHTITTPAIEIQTPKDKTNSLFFKQFKIDSLRISNKKSLVDIKYHPKLNWFADAGLLGSNPALLYKNFGTSFGLNFFVPIYDGKQKNLQYQKIAITESTRTNYESFFKNQFNQHIEQINMQFKEIEQLSAQMQKQVTDSETLIEASKQLLNKGGFSVTDFIIAIKSNIDIKNQLTQLQLRKLQLESEYSYWNW